MKLLKILPVVVLTSIILYFFTNDYIFNLNSRYFSSGGDGLKSYYCAWYHAEYDQTMGHFEGMNYPWGESISFTDGQPPVANFVKWIDKHLFPCSQLMPGIFNVLMLLSILFSAVILFLILKKYKMPDWYATLVAIGVALLSPQMGRLPGHFSLSWGFWIPLLIYLLILIIEKPTWLKSSLFAVTVLLSSLMHMYLFLFAVALIGIYWVNRLIIQREKRNYWIEFAHLCLQILLPFLIIQLLMSDSTADRGMYPYGFYAYRAYPGSVFLPVNKWYAPFISKLRFVRKYEWESLGYIGLVASVGFWLLAIAFIFKPKTEKTWVVEDEKQSQLILFWSAFLLLLFSFGLPFIMGLEKLRNSIGFLSQLRAVGRFTWLFYYVVNLIVWVFAYRWLVAFKRKSLGYGLLLTLLLVLGFEAYEFSNGNLKILNNTIVQLDDVQNKTEDNRWVSEINANDFQAIMPLPYFHIGSESSWIEARCGIDKQMYIASLKTGLPCTGVMMGRTSLSQTYKNIALSKTPWTKYEVLDEYPNNKPLLLIVAHCDELSNDEKRLVEHASLLTNTPNFDLYSLEIDSLRAIPDQCHFPAKYQIMTDSIQRVAKDSVAYFASNGGLNDASKLVETKATREFQRFIETYPIHLDVEKPLYLRFWVKDFAKDMVVRSPLLVLQCTPDHQTLEEKYSDIFRHIRTFNGEWTLIEIELQPKQEHEIIKLLFRNSVLEGEPFYFDEFSVSQLEL